MSLGECVGVANPAMWLRRLLPCLGKEAWSTSQPKCGYHVAARYDYIFAATCWVMWGLGDHRGVIAPVRSKQPLAQATYVVMQRYCVDASSFVNRIELF